LEDCYAGGFWQ